MGDRHLRSHKNSVEIYSGELRRSVLCGPVRVDFLQCVTKYTGQAFKGLEKVLRETFLPCLVFGILETLPPFVGSKYVAIKENQDGPT